MYERTIILTKDKRLEQFIKHLFRSKKREIETILPLLTSLDSIKNDIHKIGNTVNVRGEFGYFIKNYGFPYMLIIDYQVDFSLPLQNDPDKRKLVRTFLLAYALLAHGKGFENAHANIVFIITREQLCTVTQFITNPILLLGQIHTKDHRINAIIDSFVKNREKAKKYFKISYIFKPADGKYAAEIDRLEKIMEMYDKIIESIPEPEPKKTGTEMISEDLPPADVICRASLEKIIINGEARPIGEEEKIKYLEKNIHIIGAATQLTMPQVKDRIISTFNTIVKINPFKKDERIFIILPESSIIDGSFAVSMGTFLTKELSEYTGISVNIGKSNFDKLRKSQGFFAIENFIIKNL